MRIAVDATAIPPHRAGAGIYIFNLVRALAGVDRENEYVVFAKSLHVAEFGIDQPNVRFVDAGELSMPRRIVWEQTALPALLRRMRVDVLHSPHYTMPARMPCRSVVTFCDMVFVLFPEVHNFARRAFFRTMMRRSARRANRLIAISESTRQDVMRHMRVPGERIVAVPLAADSTFCPRPAVEVEAVCARYGLTPGRFILNVGVLEPRKNVPALLRAYASLGDAFPDVPLVIAGKKGWMYEEIFRAAHELGFDRDSSRVRFVGHVPEDDLVPLYNGARVFVYPSRYEGFGLPVLEALQCGAPTITTNVSSMPEVAGDSALLVSPDDVEGLSGALCKVLSDDRLAQELSRRGVEQAKPFSWRRCAQETLQVYRSVV